MTTRTSPEPLNVRLSHVAANYIELAWADQSAGGFLYDIEKFNANQWTRVITGFTGDSYYVSGLQAETEYKLRIRTRVPIQGYTVSDWVETESVRTFATNSFSIQGPDAVSVYDNMTKTWLRDNSKFIDFNNNTIAAALTSDSFSFNAADKEFIDIEDTTVVRDEEQFIYGDVPAPFLNTSEFFAGWWDGFLYVFKTDEDTAFFSSNKGSSWTQYTIFSTDVAVKPEDGRGFKATAATAAILGRDYIYSGANFTSQLTWSSTEVKWSSTTERFADISNEFSEDGGGGAILSWQALWKLPAGAGVISSYDLGPKWIAVASDGYIWKQSRELTTRDPETTELVWDPVIEHRAGAVIKHLTWFNGLLYYLDVGDGNGPTADSGVWRLDPVTGLTERVLAASVGARVQPAALGRTSSQLVVSLDPAQDDAQNTDFARPLRKTYKSSDGLTWVQKNEQFTYEAQYTFLAESGYRIYVDTDLQITAIEPEENFTKLVMGGQEFTTTGQWNFSVENIDFANWPGFASGVVFYKEDTQELIAFYEFPWRLRNFGSTDIIDNLLFRAELASISRGTAVNIIGGVPVRVNTPKPGIEHLLEKIAPETYVHDTPRFGEFMRTYLRYVSDPNNNGYYSDLSNYMDNQDVNTSVALDLFETDLSKRNTRLSREDREEFIRFINNRSQDWWSIRGTIDSYKYLFRVLYDADVEIDVPQLSNVETSFVLIPDSDIDPENDLPGMRIAVPGTRFTGYINYVREEFNGGIRSWRIVIQDARGELAVGDTPLIYKFTETVVSGRPAGEVLAGLTSRIITGNQDEFLNRGRAFYTLRIKSAVNSRQYMNNVLQFVHPVGFNIEATLLLVMLINAGISTRHETTIIDRLLTYTWDRGVPFIVPSETAVLDANLDYTFDADGNIRTQDNPLAGNTVQVPFDYYEENPEVVYGLTTEERRLQSSPMFDYTLVRFTNFIRSQQ